VLVIAERYELALAAFNRALEEARKRGSVIDIGGALAFRAELHTRTGDLTSAEVDARTLLELATASGWGGGQGFAAAWLGEVLVERGELEEAAEVLRLDDASLPDESLPRGYTTGELLFSRGRARLARGDLEGGIESLRASGRWSTGTGVMNPAGSPWRSMLALALMERGDAEEARRLVAEELEAANRFGTPRAVAIALRAAALVDGGRTHVARLREAVSLLANSPAVLEAARANAALGAALRHAGAPAEEVREPLRVAVDLAHRCRAYALEDEALDELRATGARPRRRLTTGVAALTPKERRIADLAAEGQQNREIAQALWVTTHTVEFHLRNAYRKLGISSRTELGAALGQDAREAAAP
jgi:ATP/maltotriose-dependent transcriptional regulator MalT